MRDNLKHKTLNALSWSFIESIGMRGVQFVVGIVLARLLFPEQFGLIGMLTIFMGLMRVFLDSGFGAALIQKREITQTDICSIFYFNIVVGLAAAGLLCVAAPWIAAFYKQPVLTSLTRALSLTIVINSFGLIQGTMLAKQINFKTQTKVSLISGALSGIIGITLAVLGFGVWSLVVQQVSAALFSTLSLWSFSSWRPAWIFSFNSLRELFGFGSRLLFSGLLNQIFDNSYLLVIGKLFSATSLGYFTRAQTLQNLPSDTVTGMVAKVIFPVFSSIQDDPARLKRGMKKALIIMAMVYFPLMIGMAAVARPLVLVMLTEKWAACIPYFRLLCLAGLLGGPLHMVNLHVIQAVGRSDLFFRVEIVKKVMTVINIAITWKYGITAMIYGLMVHTIISYYLNSYYTGALISYPFKEQVRDLSPYMIMALLMGMTVFAVGLLLHNLWLMLFIQILCGIIMYVFLCRVFRLAAFMETWQTVWNRMPLAGTGTAK